MTVLQPQPVSDRWSSWLLKASDTLTINGSASWVEISPDWLFPETSAITEASAGVNVTDGESDSATPDAVTVTDTDSAVSFVMDAS